MHGARPTALLLGVVVCGGLGAAPLRVARAQADDGAVTATNNTPFVLSQAARMTAPISAGLMDVAGTPAYVNDTLGAQRFGSVLDAAFLRTDAVDPFSEPLSFSAAVFAYYDDNILRRSDNIPPPQGFSRGDYSTVAQAGLAANTPLGAQTLFVNGQYGIRRYQSDTQLNTSSYDVNGGMRWQVGDSCGGTLTGSDTVQQTPLEILQQPIVNKVTRVSGRQDGACQLGAHLLLGMGFTWADNSNSADSLRFNDNRQYTATTSLSYGVRDLYSTGVEAAYSNWDFVNRTPQTSSLTPSADQVDVTWFYQRNITAKLSAKAKVGVTSTEIQSSGLAGSQGITQTRPTYSGQVIWQALPKVGTFITFDRTVSAPIGVLADYVNQDQYRWVTSWKYSELVSFDAGFSYSDRSYYSGGNVVSREDKTYRVDLVAAYQITPTLEITTRYSYLTQKTDPADTNLHSNLVMIGLSFKN